MLAAILAIFLLLFDLFVALGVMSSVTIQALAIVNMVVLAIIILVALLPATASWSPFRAP